jgi:site-specific recombinase XerD
VATSGNPVATDLTLPYSVQEYLNPRSKSISYRVKGTWKGERFRKNFADGAEARALCDFKNAEVLRGQASAPVMRLVQTRIPEGDLMAIEVALEKAAGRWKVAEVLEAGLQALAAVPKDVLLLPLFEAWLERMEKDLGATWLAEIKHRGGYFFRQNETLTSRQFTPEYFARWLGGLKVRGQTKANYRNALSRWAADMKTEGVLPVNPCVGLQISRKKDRGQPPTVLLPAQVEAFVAVHLMYADLAPQLGWVVECLFVGLRPKNEAPHAVWSEIDLKAGEQSVLGYKRGVKPRRIRLHETALAWLQVVKKRKLAKLAPYSTWTRRLAVRRANEWLAEHQPKVPAIEWDEDILRHTFASMQAAAGTPMDKLADMMGTSTRMIYSHYRHVRPAAEAKVFWAATPERIQKLAKS